MCIDLRNHLLKKNDNFSLDRKNFQIFKLDNLTIVSVQVRLKTKNRGTIFQRDDC